MDFSLDPETTARVLIDLEHAIVAMNLAPYTSAEVVGRSAKLAEAFRRKGGTVVYVHVLVTEMAQLPVDEPLMRGGPPPANASELVPEAGVQAGGLVVWKRQWGGVYGRGLEQRFRRGGIRRISSCGSS